jgi:3-phosphoshikimate 1-carboxyvinyltransferase
MKFIVNPSKISGSVVIPGSKSHTIRALVFAMLAKGESVIRKPLDSSDTRSCLEMIKIFGAEVEISSGTWRVKGKGMPEVPLNVIDVGNSGTTLYIGLGLAGLVKGYTVFTGDHQIRSRPAGALVNSLNSIGAEAFSTAQNGKPPILVKGPITGGNTSIEAVTSQYLTSLLISTPLASNDSVIEVPLLYEKPYVDITLSWLDKLGIKYDNRGYERFLVSGRQNYSTFDEEIAADFSSAAFFFTAAAITGSTLTLKGLDFNDSQGDKEVVDILRKMGCFIEVSGRSTTIKSSSLKGGTFDLNAIPDALPALAVCSCFAEGETRLINVPQARLKETDRISVMREELSKMGARIEELPDGLAIKKSSLRGAKIDARGDHRVVMSIAAAGLAADGQTIIESAESAAVTFPEFYNLMASLGADIIMEK